MSDTSDVFDGQAQMSDGEISQNYKEYIKPIRQMFDEQTMKVFAYTEKNNNPGSDCRWPLILYV